MSAILSQTDPMTGSTHGGVVSPPAERRVEDATRTTPSVRAPRLSAPLLIGVGLIVVAVAGMAYNLAQLSAGLDLPGQVRPVLVGIGIGILLVARVAFRAGQYSRGYAHARGIRRSHWSAIRGGRH